MAGTIVASTLSDGTNSTSTTNCITGSAKAWVNFDGTSTPSIRASYNVSSVTKNSTGIYTLNFTNAFADANYSLVSSFGIGGSGGSISYNNAEAVPTTSAARISTTSGALFYTDAAYCYAAIYR